MVNFSLEGKTALVTGGVYGIGFAIAKALHEAGARIVYNCNTQESMDMGVANYKEAGIDAKGYMCDVTDEEGVKAMVADIEKNYGGVDILVNVLPGKSKPIVQDIMSVVELLVLIMLTVVSSQYVYSLIFSRGVMKIAMTDLLRVPKWWTGIAVPIGFGLSTLYQVRFLLKDRLHIIKDKEAAAE